MSILAINVKRVASTLILCLAAFALGSTLAPKANSATVDYNRTAAANYALKYACNGSNCRNPAYASHSSDCTNFASQVLAAGGKKNVMSGSRIWYFLTKSTQSASWNENTAFEAFWTESGKGRSTQTSFASKMKNAYTNASRGDVYVYDWGRGSGWSHLAVSAGYGAFASYYDSGAKRNYRSITDGTGDYVAQHSTDRVKSPWNWGYWTEKDPTVRAKMKTKIIHIK